MILLPLLQKVDPTITYYSTQTHIIQTSAEGLVIETNSDKVKHLFVKYVQADKYKHKQWIDLRRTLSYTRNEVRFYNEILPLLKSALGHSWGIAPQVHLAEYNLEDLFSSEETATAYHQPIYNDKEYSVLNNKYGAIVMENLNLSRPQMAYQQNPLEPRMILNCLKGLAKFHASAYQHPSLLLKISDRLNTHGGSFHLQNRNPNELTHLESTWSTFCTNMKSHAPSGFFDRQSISSLGTRLYKMAEHISVQLSPSPNDQFATVIHGDAKAMNIFLFQDDENHSNTNDCIHLPVFIDFASAGVGLGMSDVAMHITHALDPTDYPLEDELVSKYIESFREEIPQEVQHLYSDDIAKKQYRYAFVDYFRFILGRQWKGATMDVFQQRGHDLNFAMVNRSFKAALLFIEKADAFLQEIEYEVNLSSL